MIDIQLPEEKIQRLQRTAQIGYNLITHNYDDYAFDNGRAEFIVETLIEPEQGLVSEKAFVDLFGVEFSLEGYADLFQALSGYLNSLITLDEFPGYDDYWFSVGLDEDGSVTVRLMVGESTISYIFSDADGTPHYFDNLSSVFEQDIPKNVVLDVVPKGVIATSTALGNVVFTLAREDELPFTEEEFNLVSAKLRVES